MQRPTRESKDFAASVKQMQRVFGLGEDNEAVEPRDFPLKSFAIQFAAAASAAATKHLPPEKNNAAIESVRGILLHDHEVIKRISSPEEDMDEGPSPYPPKELKKAIEFPELNGSKNVFVAVDKDKVITVRVKVHGKWKNLGFSAPEGMNISREEAFAKSPKPPEAKVER